MAVGAVIENLSTRKLTVLAMLLFFTLLVFIVVGGFVAPRPSMAVQQLAVNCINRDQPSSAQAHNVPLFLPNKCDYAHDLADDARNLEPDQIVFSAVIPKWPNEMSPWFQYMLTILQLTISYSKDNEVAPDATLFLDVSISYSDDEKAYNSTSLWMPLAHCQEIRKLECFFNYTRTEEHEGFSYDCDAMHLFQLGSIAHKYYLVNVRLPTQKLSDAVFGKHNKAIGNVEEVYFITISQTGGFTQVWLSMKSVVTVIMFFPILWFWQRVKLLDRKPELIEKAILSLGISMWIMDIPFEYFCVFFNVPWMQFFVDIRQGFFYTILLSFWIIFIGEHLMDQAHRNKISSYKYQLSAIFIGSTALLAFDVAERGYQMISPCSTIWNTPNIATGLLVIAIIMGVLYFILLLYLVFRVFRSISYKSKFGLNPQQQSQFRKTINRFRVLMILTVTTAALTVVMYNLSQTFEGALQIGGSAVEVNSAFFTGVYGLWNIYVVLVLSMYAPSHKQYPDGEERDHRMDSRQELITLTVSEQQQLLQATQEKETTN